MATDGNWRHLCSRGTEEEGRQRRLGQDWWEGEARVRSEMPKAERISRSGQSEQPDAAETSNWMRAYMLFVAIRNPVIFARTVSVQLGYSLHGSEVCECKKRRKKSWTGA